MIRRCFSGRRFEAILRAEAGFVSYQSSQIEVTIGQSVGLSHTSPGSLGEHFLLTDPKDGSETVKNLTHWQFGH